MCVIKIVAFLFLKLIVLSVLESRVRRGLSSDPVVHIKDTCKRGYVTP